MIVWYKYGISFIAKDHKKYRHEIAINIMLTLLIIPEHAIGMSPPYTDCAPYLDKVLFMTTWTIAMAI